MSPTAPERILYTKPWITDRDVELVTDAARFGWGPRCYEYINRFERDFSQYTGANYAIATSSCTGALHMGLAALGVGPGDEVILADTNWIASAAPVTYLGAKPVFVDILPDTWCLDPARVEAAMTPRTKAILAVHLYGNLCAMDELLAIGRHFGVPVIEDSAEALGSFVGDAHTGTLGAFGAFSFHGTKTLTTGEGGMFITQDANLYDRVLTLSNHGRARSQARQFWPDEIGFKYKISNIQAALGCAQLERVETLVARKREIFAYYQAALSGLQGLSMNPEGKDETNSYWMPTVVFDAGLGVTRDSLIAAYGAANIDARVFFWPLSGMDMFEPVAGNRHAFDIPERAINLPSYHEMTTTEQDRVIAVIHRLYRGGVTLAPTISVVIPAYNAARFIGETLQSLCRQSTGDWEAWVVDDGSTDTTAAIVADLVATDPRIHLHQLAQNRGGPAGPRNVGVALATGEWIAFLDADDIWHPQKLAHQLATVRRYEADFCCTAMEDFSGPVPGVFRSPEAPAVSWVSFAMQRRKSRIPLSTVLMRRTLAEAFPFNEDPRYRAVEDYHCWLRILEAKGPVLKLGFPFLYYRVTPGQISASRWDMLRRFWMVHREYPDTGVARALYYLLTHVVFGIRYRLLARGL